MKLSTIIVILLLNLAVSPPEQACSEHQETGGASAGVRSHDTSEY